MRAAALLVPLALAACVGPPPIPELLAPRDPALATLQARQFDTVRAEETAQLVVTVLQDLGFQIAASDAALGLIVATRGHDRKASEYAAQVGKDLLQILKNTVTFQWHREPDAHRSYGKAGFHAVVLITPAASGSRVRITLHRYVTRPTGEAVVVWAEELPAPESYRRFFALLDEALARERARR